MSTATESTVYNVQCHVCNRVWQPIKNGGLWKAAKHRAETQPDRLDAMGVGPTTCGCEQPVNHPEAPFRVFGFDSVCEDYDIPCRTFIQAVKTFKKLHGYGDTVFISGVSDRVRRKIEYGC